MESFIPGTIRQLLNLHRECRETALEAVDRHRLSGHSGREISVFKAGQMTGICTEAYSASECKCGWLFCHMSYLLLAVGTCPQAKNTEYFCPTSYCDQYTIATITVVGRDVQPIMDLYKLCGVVL